MMRNLVVIGNVSQDTICYQGVCKGSSWGGAGLNISLSAAQLLNERPRLMSVVGDDALDLLSQLEKKVDISLIKVSRGKTCRFDIQYLSDGTLQNVGCDFGVATGLTLHFQAIELPLAHYHVSCRRPLNPEQVLPRIVKSNLSFSLDFILSSACQQIVRSEGWIRLAKYVFVNSQEVKILEGLYNIDDIQILIITSGSQPVRVLRLGHEILSQSCDNKVFYDVTGAGDVFIGTFLGSQIGGDELHLSIDKAIFMAQQSLDNIGVIRFLG